MAGADTEDMLKTARAPLPANADLNRRSRRIRILKVLLPLTAVALLIGIIAWPGIISTDANFALTYANISTVNDDLRMISPRFTGSDAQNRRYIITADMATQQESDRELVTLDILQADIAMADGSWIAVSAATGEFHTGRQTLLLEGRIDAYSDLGYEFHAKTAAIDLNEGSLTSDLPVQGQGPLGQLSANGIRVSERGQNMLFIGGVKVTIFPQTGAAS
ncbi:MAG TPA: LPS export ABC transporter periplasmic protein LptC [Alphaproteobacteria bacterium]|nr:LPS export ABC transporter periplasmic protein LptC [Alphaproteobacteria bacterium]